MRADGEDAALSEALCSSQISELEARLWICIAWSSALSVPCDRKESSKPAKKNDPPTAHSDWSRFCCNSQLAVRVLGDPTSDALTAATTDASIDRERPPARRATAEQNAQLAAAWGEHALRRQSTLADPPTLNNLSPELLQRRASLELDVGFVPFAVRNFLRRK